MKIHLSRSIVLSTGLVLALSVLSSCGKSKDSKSNPAPTVAAQTTPAPTTTTPTLTPQNPPLSPPTGGLTQPPVTNPNPNNMLPQPTNPTPSPMTNSLPALPKSPATSGQGQELLPSLSQMPVNRSAGQVGGRNENQRQRNSSTPNLVPNSSNTRDVVQDLNHVSDQASKIDFNGQVAVKTGAQENDLFYTSAGDDLLMQTFKMDEAAAPVSQQMMNTKLSQSIVLAKLNRNPEIGEMAVDLSVNELGSLKTYRFIATNDNDKMKLTLIKVGTTGLMPYQGGFLKCVDLDGRCDVAYAKIKLAGGYARLIFRGSVANTHYLIQEKVTDNVGFSLLSNYMLNAVNDVNTSERIDETQLSSFEVVNGRAGMGALITTVDRQMINLSIPMVVSEVDSEVNTNVMKVSDLSKQFDLPSLGNSYSLELSKKINKIKLVKNNGLGQFKLQLLMGSQNSPASIWIVMARVHKDIMSTEQIRLFESKLRAF